MKAVQGALVSLDSGDSLQDFSALLLQCLSGFLPDLGSMLMNSHDFSDHSCLCSYNCQLERYSRSIEKLLAKCVVIGIPALLIVVFISQMINILNYFLVSLICSSHDEIKEHHMQSVCCCSCMGICQQFWLWLVHIIISIQTHNLAVVLIVLGSLVLLLVYWYNYCGIKIWECHSSASFCTQPWYWMAGRFGTVLASHTIANCGSSLLCHLCLCGFCWSGISPVLQLNSFRTKFILGFSLFLGLPVPQYFKDYILVSGRGPVHTGATWLFCCTSQPAETVAGTGGRGSDILVKTPGVRSSIQLSFLLIHHSLPYSLIVRMPRFMEEYLFTNELLMGFWRPFVYLSVHCGCTATRRVNMSTFCAARRDSSEKQMSVV
ncbi:hypothetical protein NC652_003045 [Populus alba x Populus x berolinensis]|nr:hypothetical protein NC652_003045 [Populus alba x Populus x berolinensis]